VTMLTPDFGADPTTNPSREVPDPITELLRAHARELIAAALEAEVQLVMNQLRTDGADVVRNGYLPERTIDAAWKLWRLLLLEEDGAWQTIQGRNDTPMS
jgi:hypothetical protein